MNEDFKAAKKKQEARKRIKELKSELSLEKAYLSFGMESPSLFRERIAREREQEYINTPIDKKQRFMDIFRSGKMNLGQAADEVGITSDVASQVLLRNIDEHQFWSEKVTK